jgi:hypothetical protein
MNLKSVFVMILALLASDLFLISEAYASSESENVQEIPLYSPFNKGWFGRHDNVHIGEYPNVPETHQLVNDVSVERIIRVQPIPESIYIDKRSGRMIGASIEVVAEIKIPKTNKGSDQQVVGYLFNGRGSSQSASTEATGVFKREYRMRPIKLSFHRLVPKNTSAETNKPTEYEIKEVKAEVFVVNGITSDSLKGPFKHRIQIDLEPKLWSLSALVIGKSVSYDIHIDQIKGELSVAESQLVGCWRALL